MNTETADGVDVLVGQKDVIYRAKNECECPLYIDGHDTGNFFIPHKYLDKVRIIIEQLRILQPLWIAAGYMYKGTEICDLLDPLLRWNYQVIDNRAKRKLAEVAYVLDDLKSLRDAYYPSI